MAILNFPLWHCEVIMNFSNSCGWILIYVLLTHSVSVSLLYNNAFFEIYLLFSGKFHLENRKRYLIKLSFTFPNKKFHLTVLLFTIRRQMSLLFSVPLRPFWMTCTLTMLDWKDREQFFLFFVYCYSLWYLSFMAYRF